MRGRAALLAALLLLVACKEQQSDATAESSAAAVTQSETEMPPMGGERRLLAFGDSLFAGYGLKSGESYPARLEAALRAKGIAARIANAGVSGDTTAAALQRLEFTLNNQAQPPELAVISLGGNDMLRGLPPAQTRENLDHILTEFGRRRIKVVLFGMLAAPNLGASYAREFNAIYPALAAKHHAVLVPFFLASIIDKPWLRQADHVHPTRDGVEELVAATAGDVAKALPSPGKAATGAAAKGAR
jgi:acyl-CoA thioesterase-1